MDCEILIHFIGDEKPTKFNELDKQEIDTFLAEITNSKTPKSLERKFYALGNAYLRLDQIKYVFRLTHD